MAPAYANRLLATLIVLVVCSAAAAQSPATGCNVPHLAPGYCDADGDMVADTPSDRAQWLDPNPLIVGEVPVRDQREIGRQFEPFLAHLGKVTGRRVAFREVADYQTMEQGFRSNQLHIINANTGNGERFVHCFGYRPILALYKKDELAGYRMTVIVPAGSPIREMEHLRGRTITFVDRNSNSGFLAPVALFASRFNLHRDVDYQVTFSGRHDISILGVGEGRYEAAPVADDAIAQVALDGQMDEDRVRSIYRSEPFPLPPIGVSHRLAPDLVVKIVQAYESFDWSEVEWVKIRGTRFAAANYARDWAIMRETGRATRGGPPAC